MKQEIKEQIRIAELNLERFLEWTSRYDNKASIIVGITIAMLGTLTTFAPAIDKWTKFTIIASASSVLLLSGALVFAFIGNYPQTKSPNRTLLFFGAINKLTFNEYQSQFKKQNDEDYLNDLLEQCHRNSEILALKFFALKWVYRLLFLTVPAWAFSIYLFKFCSVK